MTDAGRPGAAMLATLIAAGLLAGCAGDGTRPARLADRAAPRSAVAVAEAVVAASPRDAAARLTLARTYMAAGRFASAGKTYQDVLTLRPDDPAAGVGLALMEVAVGRQETARARLAALPRAPAADAGLARALAGDVSGAIDLLADAARGPEADARVRQNLALALALAGRWQEARAVASQDLAREMVDRRLGEWAAMGGTPAPDARVALLIGTRPTTDPGQPPALALAAEATPAIMLAHAKPASTPAAAAAPAPSRPPATPPLASPMRVAAGPIGRPSMVALPIARLVLLPARPPVTTGRWVVQLGAYSTEARAERAWRMMEPRLAGRTPLVASRGGANRRPLVRLSVGGFATRAGATAACRATGGDCFVRVVRGDRLAGWWPAGGRQLAAR